MLIDARHYAPHIQDALANLRDAVRRGDLHWNRAPEDALARAGLAAYTPALLVDTPWYGPLDVPTEDDISDICLNGDNAPMLVYARGGCIPYPLDLHPAWLHFVQRQLVVRSQRALLATWEDWRRPDGHITDMLTGSADDRLRFAIQRPAATRHGPSIVVRVIPTRWRTMEDLQQMTPPALTGEASALLRGAVDLGVTVLVAGATSSGKTTVTAALLQAIGITKRAIVIEQAGELPSLPNSISVEADLARGTTFADCVYFALRQRPDLIVVGEIRGVEALAFLRAANSGHPCIGTIHAPSPESALRNLARMAAETGEVTPTEVRGMLATPAAPILVVHVGATPNGARQVLRIDELLPQLGSSPGDPFPLNPLFARTAGALTRCGWVQGDWGRSIW